MKVGDLVRIVNAFGHSHIFNGCVGRLYILEHRPYFSSCGVDFSESYHKMTKGQKEYLNNLQGSATARPLAHDTGRWFSEKELEVVKFQSIEAKPPFVPLCPFCGGQSVVFEATKWNDKKESFQCHCHVCDAFGPRKETKKEATVAWTHIFRQEFEV